MNGTYIGVEFDSLTEQVLRDWCEASNVRAPTKFHSTLIFVEDRYEVGPYDWSRIVPPDGIRVDPETFQFKLLGPSSNTLVLAYACPVLEQLHQAVRHQCDLSWPHLEYIPHVTLTYDPVYCETEFTLPHEPLVIARAYSAPFIAPNQIRQNP